MTEPGDPQRREGSRPASRGSKARREPPASSASSQAGRSFRPRSPAGASASEREVKRPDRGSKPPDRETKRQPSRSGGAVRAQPQGAAALASTRRVEPALPEDVTGRELDRQVRAELSSLAKPNADAVARHLVMAARLLHDDPEAAYAHALAAQRRAGRVGAVREATGLAAYAAGHYAEALAELRAARRISGDHSVLPIMADCERGLGRPEKALAVAADPLVGGLDPAVRIEMSIVVSGARRDLGQAAAAIQVLQSPHLRSEARDPWSARLFYAYAEALLAAGRTDEALAWFGSAAAADVSGETDAEERALELSGVTFAENDEDDPEGAAEEGEATEAGT